MGEGRYAEGVQEQGSEDDIQAYEGQDNRGVEKTTYRGALRPVLVTKYNLDDQINSNEMGRACSTYGEEAGYIQDFGGEAWGREKHLKTQTQMGG